MYILHKSQRKNITFQRNISWLLDQVSTTY